MTSINKPHRSTSLHPLWLAAVLASPAAIATPVGIADDFESYTSGTTPPLLDWSTKYAASPSDQQGLLKVQDAIGYGASKGYSLDVFTAFQSYNSIRSVAVTGGGVIIQSDFQISTDGTLLNDGVAPSGVNKAIFGLEVRNDPNWYAGNGFTVAFARRDDGNWGLSVIGTPFITGFKANSLLGLSPAAGAGLPAPAATSDWFTLQLELIDTGAVSPDPAWTYSAKVVNKTTGAVALETGPFALPATFLTGSTLYGGVSTPYTGFTTDRVNTVGKVTAATADNFSIFGYSTTEDLDNDGLVEFDEIKAGTSDNNPDSDDDGYSDGFEVTNGYDPLDPKSNPTDVLYADYTTANGYVNGDLSGQKGWKGQLNTQVATGTGMISDTGGGYIRTVHGNGVLGSTGGNPGTATGYFSTGDIIEINYDYQFTLPSPLANVGLASVGFRGETTTNSLAKQGFKMQFNQFAPESGGGIKFWPDLIDTANGDALIIDGSLFGLNGAGNPAVGDGNVDLESDPIRIAYTAKCTDADTYAWEVTGFTVTNLTTSQTWDYVGPTQTFTYDDDGAASVPTDAFFAQQLAPNGNATFTGRSGRVLFQYGSVLVDNDSDGLTQAEELLLGTSDGKSDTDGDGISDPDEVLAGTDPLDPLDPNGGVSIAPVITSFTFTGGNTVNIIFTGAPSTTYKLMQGDLVTPFATTGTTATTNGTGEGSVEHVIPSPVPTKSFFRIEE